MTIKDEAAPRSLAIDMLILAALAVALIFTIGVAVGFFDAAADHGPKAVDVVVGGITILIAVLCAWQLVARTLRLFRPPAQKVGPSVRKTRNLWAFFIGIGLVAAMAMELLKMDTGTKAPDETATMLLSDASIGPSLAAALLIGLLIVTALSVVYYRLIDEHDFASQGFASLVAINFYMFATIGWWIAAKGGFVAAPDHGAIMLAVAGVWFAVWLWRRFV